jgi:hypothetical protein
MNFIQIENDNQTVLLNLDNVCSVAVKSVFGTAMVPNRNTTIVVTFVGGNIMNINGSQLPVLLNALGGTDKEPTGDQDSR